MLRAVMLHASPLRGFESRPQVHDEAEAQSKAYGCPCLGQGKISASVRKRVCALICLCYPKPDPKAKQPRNTKALANLSDKELQYLSRKDVAACLHKSL